MRFIFLLAMLFFNINAYSQKHIADLFIEKMFACDTGFSQLELNICNAEKAGYAAEHFFRNERVLNRP